MHNYLLEVGVEEFPSRYIESTKAQFESGFRKQLEAERIRFDALQIDTTPRRFAIRIDGLRPDDETAEEVLRGPSVRISYDENGAPTKALQGFLRSKGVSQEDLYTEVQGKDTYVFVKIKKESADVKEVLQRIVPEIVRNISNPRAMRWGGKNLQFLRPIRWFVSLLDDEVLPFDLEGIPVSNVTKGHMCSSQHVEIPTIASYEKRLEENGVIVSEKTRRDIILRGINRLAREKGGVPMLDEVLLDEVVHIVEYPTVFLGNIKIEYLSLPPEVVITPMKDHQRYFPVLDDNGKLLPYFLSVRNGGEEGLENVIHGNERVLAPRLDDAKFFYDQDSEQDLESYVEKLKDLGFHEGLGSMFEKTLRLEKLVQAIGVDMAAGDSTIHNAMRAATLSKADLVTKMVVEFTELQGTMGRIYATNQGENKIVATAIEEQYMPTQSGAALPESTAGILLSLADKIDTIAGLYAIGVQVTGSQDPYGLRRAAIGIINILLDQRIALDLEKIFREALFRYVEQFGLVFDYDEIYERIRSFFYGRLRNQFLEEGKRHDIIDAVLAVSDFDVALVVEKVEALEIFFEKSNVNEVITSFVRVESMAEKSASREIDEKILEAEELPLYNTLHTAHEVKTQMMQMHYAEALEILEKWMPVVNQYMDDVMILVDDLAVRENRLAMIGTVYDAIKRFLKPSLIVRD